jgi:hypothetical protein
VKLLTCSGGNETEGKFPIHCSIYRYKDNKSQNRKRHKHKWETPRTMKVVLEHSPNTTQSPKTLGTMTELVECNTTPQDSRNNERSSGALL